MRIHRQCLLLALGLEVGCHSSTFAASGSDVPAPADEPRAQLRVEVSLQRATDCEEVFDLSLYRNRGIELIQWEPSSTPCAGRKVRIRYFPKRLQREELARMVTQAAITAKVIEE